MSDKTRNTPPTLPDEGTFLPVATERSSDPLGFPGYAEALVAAETASWGDEAVVAGPALVGGHPVELALFDFTFLAGSMGEVAGERLALAMERAAVRGVPFILRTETGGARMQEGMRALVQMPKVVVARLALADAHQAFVALLGHPTTGGVLAGLGALADVTIAEAGATVGFAGPRVVATFTGDPVGSDSHTSETALAAGLVDDVVDPTGARELVRKILAVLAEDDPELVGVPAPAAPTVSTVLNPWEAVTAARAAGRPTGKALLQLVSSEFVLLRGDRGGHDDPAIVTALARIAGRRVVVCALDRAHAPGPAGYRKARRCAEIAERLGLPLVTFIDTPGADPSPRSERGGIAWEIAKTFECLLTLQVPVLSIVSGAGGSGGALALAVADTLLIYDDAYFSVIGPEAAAEIMWRDDTRAPDAARMQKLTAATLIDLGIADGVLATPIEPRSLRDTIAYHLDRSADEIRHPADRAHARRRRWRDSDALSD